MDGMRVSAQVTSRLVSKWLDHPAFGPLLDRTVISFGRVDTPIGIACCVPHRITLSPELQPNLRSLVVFRLAIEFSWLRGLPRLTDDVSLVLAARAAAGFLACMPDVDKVQQADDEVLQVIAQCADECPSHEALQTLILRLQSLELISRPKSADHTQSISTYSQIRSLWQFAAAAEALIISGGDERLSLDGQTGRNRYGCSPFPDARVIELASSTASSITTDTLEVVEGTRQKLLETARACGAVAALEEFSCVVRSRISKYFEVDDIAECLLTASGTDAALLTTVLLKAQSPNEPFTSILMSPTETGSGIPQAVLGRHFADSTAVGRTVRKGDPLSADLSSLSLQTVRSRNADGSCRPTDEIDNEVILAVERALENGSVVLHALHGSKTDLVVPSLQACIRLAAMEEPRLHIIIDACQARCSPPLVRRFIELGFSVVVTGSKFFAAPGFCGAILFPKETLRQPSQAECVALGISPYATSRNGIVQRRCPGLILRWTAALYTMDRLRALSTEQFSKFLAVAAKQIRQAAALDARLYLVDTQNLDNAGGLEHRSIFTFKIRVGADFLSFEALRSIYATLSQPTQYVFPGISRDGSRPSVRFGQPVKLGEAGAAGLRLAVSARHVFESTDLQPQLALAFGQLSSLLDAM